MLFKVVHKDTKEVVDVYQISNDESGNPIFLVYLDNHWFHCDANVFEPYVERPPVGVNRKLLFENNIRKDKLDE